MAFFLFLLVPLMSTAAVNNKISVVTSVQRPFVILETDGRMNGVYRDYLDILLKKAGLEGSYETMPAPRVLNHAAKGTYDFFIYASGAPETQKNYIEITHFCKLSLVLISDEKILALTGKALTIGKPLGSDCPLFTAEENKHIKFFEYESASQAYKMLKANRLSAICTTREVFKYEIQHSDYAGAKYYEIPKYQYDFILSLFVHKRLASQKIASLTKAAAELEQKKVLSTIYKKYGLSENAAN